MELQQLLYKHFGYSDFRPGQEEIISSICEGQDTIGILPTGSGKTLCYQLPAYVLEGPVLIISPLVALMEDQVSILKKNGEKRVVALNSFLPFHEKDSIIRQLATYKFIFISPEMLVQPKTKKALQSLSLSLIVIDEAHCISQWGFDFRPDYLRIGTFFDEIKRPPILALTATANDKVVEDITHYLSLHRPFIHRQSMDRSNIIYAIIQMTTEHDKNEWITHRLQHTMGPGIIYVSSRKRADALTSQLKEQGIAVESYHAGREKEDRAFIQAQFINGDLDWICATNAFGMGIHKDNIRQIIHEHMPSNPSAYVQEVGRAGRDGQLAVATLLYAPLDERKNQFILQEDLPDEAAIKYYDALRQTITQEKELAEKSGLSETAARILHYYFEHHPLHEVIEKLNAIRIQKEQELHQMQQLIQTGNCIRSAILAMFDEQQNVPREICCTNCENAVQEWLFQKYEKGIREETMNWSKRLSHILGFNG